MINSDNNLFELGIGPEIASLHARALMKTLSDQVFVVLVMTANHEEATRIGKAMVHEKMAACANIIPQIQSIYRWKGKVVTTQEVLLILKSTKTRYRALESAIKAMHTYETPEIIALPVRVGFDQYIEWIRSETTAN